MIFTIVVPHAPQGSPAAPVHQELVLEGAVDAVDVAEVVDRRALGLDAGAQRVDDRVRQAFVLVGRQRPGGPEGMDPGPEQGLVGVDVPDPGDHALVEQECLDRGPAAARERAQVRGA